MDFKPYIQQIPPYTPGVKKAGAVKMASNENPFGPSPAAVQAVRDYLDGANVYPDGSCAGLKAALAEKFSQPAGRIILGNGSDEILQFTGTVLMNPGDNAVIYENTFSIYATAVTMFGGQLKHLPFTGSGFDIAAIPELVDDRTKIVYLCNPNNPTGTWFKHNELESLLQVLPETILVALDEAYVDFAADPEFPRSLELTRKYRNLLVLRTFSKLYGLAGMRIGYGFGSEELIDTLERVRMPFNINGAAQAAGTAALADDAFVKKTLENNEAGKTYLYAEFEKNGLETLPTQANFIYADLKQDSKAAFEKLMDMGVTIRPLTSFGFDTAIRVSVGTPEQNEFFISCLKKIL